MNSAKERRHFWRAHFHSPVQLVRQGQLTEADLLDISLRGALVNVPAGWTGKIGDKYQLRLNLGAEAVIGMQATVTHVDGRRIGLHCDKIDLDSVTHLRRLVELNAGDPDILDRELGALLQEND